MDEPEPPKKGKVFAKEPKKPKVKVEPVKGLFEETEGKIKEGGLRKFLSLKKDEKVTLPELRKLVKVDPGSTITFRGRKLAQTDKSLKQARLALNMMQK